MGRKRKYDVRIRMNKQEKDLLEMKLKQAGNPTIESYGLDALLKSKITSQEEIDILVEINKQFEVLNRNLTNIGTNINQIAKNTNVNGNVTSDELAELYKEIEKIKDKEVDKQWLLIRLYLAKIKHLRL